jgi:uncharacterized protein (DUF1800 family)
MITTSAPFFRRSFAVFSFGAWLLAGFAEKASAVIDNNVTSHVWKLKFGVTNTQLADPLWLDQDADADGCSNKDELAAGTSPFNPAVNMAVSKVTRNGAVMELEFPTELGKRYRIESNGSLSGGPWVLQPQPVPVQVMGNGGVKMLSIPQPAGRVFCRVRVDEVDTDGDQLSDWVEGAVALNPALPQTVPTVNDYNYVASQVAFPNTVSITAVTPFASEDGPQAGMLSVVRSNKLLPLTINYTPGGTAVAGVDYAALSGSVTLPAGVDSMPISVNPVPSSALKGGRSVTATLTPPAGPSPLYVLGAQNQATVIINDSTLATGTGLLARYYDTGASTYVDAANFGQAGTYNFTRNAVTTTGSIVVSYATLGAQNITPLLQVGHVVKLTFSSGGLNTATYNHQNYNVTAVAPTNFTVGITGAAALPSSSTGNCGFNTQTFPHPAVIQRVAPVVNNDWNAGTPNVVIAPNNSPDNYSSVWEAWIQPTTAGSYTFQLDADDKARLLLDTGAGLVQILEHGWDSPAVIGTFKSSAAIALAVPATPAQRYRIRVEHVENTGDARCRLQWKLGSGGFGNIPQANLFTHQQALTYSYTKASTTAGSVILTPTGGHTLAVGDPVSLTFSSGNLFTPGVPSGYDGPYTVTAVNGTTTFTVAIAGTSVPNTGTGSGYTDNDTSTSTGWFNRIYPNTTYAGTPGRVGVDTGLNSIWLSGTPDPVLINPDSFSVRWTGQVQPQFSEEYTFITNADDNVSLRINGQVQAMRPASATNVGGTYSYSSTTGNLVVTYPTLPAGSFVVGETARVDPTSGNLTTLAYADYTVTAASGNTLTVNIGAGLYPDSTGNINVEAINKPVNDFTSTSSERYVRIPMIGGVRYDIQLDYFESAQTARCQLFWYSPSQPRQVVPSERLYPSSLPQAPAAFISQTEATALVGGPFSHSIKASNGATVTVSGNPAWLTYSGGVLSGTAPAGAAGDYQIIITTVNAAGTGTSVLNLHVADTGGTIVREYWTGLAGTSLGTIPTTTTPAGTSNLSSLEAPTDFGDDYGARIRGYITAPVSGNYYFWIAASQAAELWISNDDEPINAFKRAWVNTGSTVPRTWNGEAGQQSPWMELEQGKRYYIEILHKAAIGAGDNLAIGWLPPGGTGTVPSEVVPGYVLAPYVAPAAGSTPGTLYVSTMLAQNGADTDGVGNSTLRLVEDPIDPINRPAIAYMTYSYSGLSGGITSQHIHTDPWQAKPSTIVYDIDTPVTPGDGLQPNGTYKWTILPVGTLSKADVINIIKEGKTYINLHTAMYPAGEIRGNYTLANGSRTFSTPPAAPAWTDDHNTNAGASRFLTQATFGASTADIAALKAMPSYAAWIDDQFTKPATPHLPEVLAREIADAFGPFDVKLSFNTWWKNSISGQDQLRQRIAFALSEIHVVSGQGPLEDNARGIAHFYDTLLSNAFGNFRDILVGTTLTPAMGRYLDMLRNDKPDLAAGRIPNENYAREIKQLFAIGLYRMWPDGTLMLNSKDVPIDTYSQREIVGFAHVFTGWDYGYDGAARTTFSSASDWTRPMRDAPGRHFTGAKRVLNNEVLPGLPVLGGQPLDPYASHNSTHFNNPAYQALPVQELDAAHDQLFNHPNVGPFICRQLIQRLVTSHPSRDYLYRVVQAFNNNGSGVRGDMKAVIKAILLDYEARSSTAAGLSTFGKQREPVLRIAAAARALRPAASTGTYAQAGTNVINITTTTPHLLLAGNQVFLEFTDTTADPLKPAPSTGSYTVLATPAPTATTYSINAPGWITGSYNQVGGSTTMTVTLNGHWLPVGGKAWFDFTSGAANDLPAFDQTVRTVVTSNSVDFASGVGNVSGTTFTITAPDTTARNGNLMIPRFGGSYGANGTSITIDTVYGGAGTYGTMADHYLSVGDSVYLNFTNSRDTTSGIPSSTVNDLLYPITTVPDPNTFTVLSSAVMNSDNQVFIFPQAPQPLTRSGTINTRPSTFNMENTDLDLAQTPLNSPTVFNFFLPDYKFSGTLASQGLTTPEFQTTAETTVVRQANFIYNGIFNPGNTNGISSFKTGTNALVLDLSPWMGNATDNGLGAGPQIGQPWTSNANLPTLIDRFNTLLLAGQLPAAARTNIQNFLYRPITSIGTGNPCTITSTAHGLVTGDSITISGVTNGTFSPTINATLTVTVLTANTFRVASNCTVVPSGSGITGAHFSPVAYNNATPSTAQIRDRLRGVLHFILTSPDFTIQR